MKNIKFVKNSGPYSPGDVAGFEGQVADAYVALGAAVEAPEAEPLAPGAQLTGDGSGQALPDHVEGQGEKTAPARKSRK